MSLRAMLWALYDADCTTVPPAAFRVLLVLADHTGDDGCGAWPKVRTIAEKLHVSDRTVQRHLAALREAGLIVEGDQQLVAHMAGDERPKVWDLCLNGVTELSPRATGVTPAVATGVTPAVAQGTVLEPSMNRPGGGPLRAVHNHEPNARRALAALAVDVEAILPLAYEAGNGDPWAGYLAIKPQLENLPEKVRDLPALLRTRLGLAKAAAR